MTPALSGVRRDQAFEESLNALVAARFASRLFNKDASLWGHAAEAEAAVRLGWTDFAEAANLVAEQAAALRENFKEIGVDRFVLCGMGGSSLAPMVIADDLAVLDSTHPDTVRAALDTDLDRTAVVVSSKSGSTIETLSHRDAFIDAFTRAGIDPASRIVVVTDPGSDLEAYAHARGMRVFNADPHIGGRFSALTAFGLVPSVLAGADTSLLVHSAHDLRRVLRQDSTENPALVLAAAIAVGLPQRLVLSVSCEAGIPAEFGMWIEQLIAESTGKNGLGVLPIAHLSEDDRSPFANELQVRVASTEAHAAETANGATSVLCVRAGLGEQFLIWEVTTAALGHLLHVDPFNQPDVEAAKIAARAMLEDPSPPACSEGSPEQAVKEVLASLRDNDYLAIQTYAHTGDTVLAEALAKLRDAIARAAQRPVALGWGPRYLHSTGQLHKGGPAVGAFLQIVDTGFEDLEIANGGTTFGQLMRAQADGDATVLRDRGRPVVTLHSDNALDTVQALIRDLA